MPEAERRAGGRKGSVSAAIAGIATHVPETVLDNDALALAFPDWSAAKIHDKLGIRERRVAAPDETASDLAFAAAEKLFEQGVIARERVDFLIFCTQAPDYILPTSACLLQSRLGLRRDIGAFDMNLGCSGFVYGLSVAAGLIASGAAANILLLTADTYSKFIHPGDRSVRTLFGDGAAATLISADGDGVSRIGPFTFGTDGAGANQLIVETGGARTARSAESAVESRDAAGNVRSRDNLHMNGAGVMSFTLREIPATYRRMLQSAELTPDDLDLIVVHQANKFMLDALQKKLQVSDSKFPRYYEAIGNTVSSSIPFTLADSAARGQLRRGHRLMLIGFGVGLSWAAATMTW